MTIDIDYKISVERANEALVSGTVSNAAQVTGVEIFDQSGNDLGPASLGWNGKWVFDAVFDQQVEIEAVETDSNGKKETSASLLIAPEAPLQGQVLSFRLSPGNDDIPFSVSSDQGRLLYDGTSDRDTSTVHVTGSGGARIAYADFSTSPEIIENFRVRGPNHDTLNLSDTGLHSLVAVLRHTTMSDGSATLHIDDRTSVTLIGVTKQQIANNPHDLVFTGGHPLDTSRVG